MAVQLRLRVSKEYNQHQWETKNALIIALRRVYMNLAWSSKRVLHGLYSCFEILAEDGATDEVVGRFCLDRRRGRRSREVLRLLLLQQS